MWRFLYKSLKYVGQCHQNQITFLLKWRWGRPKAFALSCAWLVSIVLNEKVLWENWETNVRQLIPISAWLQGWVLPALVSSFRRLRLVFWPFTSCIWDVLWYRILKKQIVFLEQNRNFPKRHWVRSKIVFLSSGGLVSLVLTIKTCFENFLRSRYLKQYVFFVQMQSRLGCVGCRKLRLIMGFKSCIWDIQYQLLKKHVLFLETWFLSFWIVYILFEGFCTNRWKMSASLNKTKYHSS